MEITLTQEGQSARSVDRVGALLLAFASVTVFAVPFFVLDPQQPNAPPAPHAPTPIAATHGNAEDGVPWVRLDDTQQAMLRPLRQAWPELDSLAKQRWLHVASRVKGLNAEAIARVHARMAEWAKASPEKRAAVRLQYVYAGHIPAAKRSQLWSVYQQLPKPALLRDRSHPSLTIVAPMVVRVGPGATTMLITQLPASKPNHVAWSLPAPGPS